MYIPNEQLDQVSQIISTLKITKNESVLLLIGEESKIDLDDLFLKLNDLGIPFFGGIFPGIIHGKNNYTDGLILKTLPTLSKPIIIKGMENNQFELTNQLNDILIENSKTTIFTIIDGLTSNVSAYLQKLYHHYGNSVNFLGAGAGSLSLVQQPCVFSNEGIFQDAAVLCPINLEVSLGVKHGWEKLEGPIVATRTDKNVIHELNWKNAFEVYKKVVEEDANVKFNDENFFDISKGYPFGIVRESGKDIVRDPISLDEKGSLICIGEVPENSVLYILKGDKDALIQSAQMAVENSIAHLDKEIEHTLIINCISRTLFLEDEFPKELIAITNAMTVVNEKSIPQGVLSLGEISSSGNGFLELHNKTVVIGALTK